MRPPARFRRYLCCQGQPRQRAQATVEVAGECALDAAACFACGRARGEQPLVVRPRFGVVMDAGQGDHLQRQFSWRSPPRFNRCLRC
jgi:hypothetical protein